MKAVPELFADLTMLMEDIHGIAVEGQQADLSSDMQIVILSAVKAGLVKVQRIMLDIAVALP